MTVNPELAGLVLLSLALFISLCLNVILCIKRRATLCRDKDECCFKHIYTEESPIQDEGRYFDSLNHEERQENPIYGNISSDRRDSLEVCYETMTMQHTRDRMKLCVPNTEDEMQSIEHALKSSQPDLNYASLDLKMAKKCLKKNRHLQGHVQGRNKLQEEPPVRLTPPVNSFLEVEADMDAHLPSRDTGIMVSHSSIYLNSQQIAQVTEEMEREWGINMERDNLGSEGIREWKREQDGSNGSVCTQQTEVEAIQSGIDHFISSFIYDSNQQDKAEIENF